MQLNQINSRLEVKDLPARPSHLSGSELESVFGGFSKMGPPSFNVKPLAPVNPPPPPSGGFSGGGGGGKLGGGGGMPSTGFSVPNIGPPNLSGLSGSIGRNPGKMGRP